MKKNTLIITAHPSRNGFTHILSNTYKTMAEENGYNVTICDLYKQKQDYLVFEDSQDIAKLDQQQKKHHHLITQAEEIVFIFPLWWGDCPAIMKNWWDQNMTSGFAYTIKNGRPIGLLKEKTARIIITAGNPTTLYKINGMFRSIKKVWKTSRLGFCGIKMTSYTFFGYFGSPTKRDKKAALQKIKNLL